MKAQAIEYSAQSLIMTGDLSGYARYRKLAEAAVPLKFVAKSTHKQFVSRWKQFRDGQNASMDTTQTMLNLQGEVWSVMKEGNDVSMPPYIVRDLILQRKDALEMYYPLKEQMKEMSH